MTSPVEHDALEAGHKARRLKVLLALVAIGVMGWVWIAAPGASRALSLRGWTTGCQEAHATWTTRQKPIDVAEWFLTSRGPILIEAKGPFASGLGTLPSTEQLPDTLRLVKLDGTREVAATPIIKNHQVFDSVEIGDSLWILLQGESHAEFELVELGLDDLKLRTSQRHPIDPSDSRVGGAPMGLVRFADSTLGVIFNPVTGSPTCTRFDPITHTFEPPVVLRGGASDGAQVHALADGSLAIDFAGEPFSYVDSTTGNDIGIIPQLVLNIDRSDPVSKRVASGTAQPVDFPPTVSVTPSVKLTSVIEHPMLRLSNGVGSPIQLLLTGWLLQARALLNGQDPHEIVMRDIRVPQVYLTTPASPFSIPLGDDLRRPVKRTYVTMMRAGLFLYALDGQQALCAQVIAPDPRDRVHPHGLIRFGTLDDTSTAITWKQYIQLPHMPEPPMAPDLVIVPSDAGWVVYLTTTTVDRPGTKGEPYAWTTIPNPVGVDTPLQQPLSTFPGAMATIDP